MIFAGFLIFLGFLSAAPLFGAVCCGRRPERLFAAGLLFNALLYYGFCAAHLCDAGFRLIFAANLGLYVPVLLKLRKKPEAFRDFLTPAVTVFYVTLTAGFLLALREFPLWWDEFSHWGSSAKFLFVYGKLNCEFPARLLGHASYPPGLAVLDTLVHKCFIGVGFRDFMPRFAIRAAKICLFLLPFGDAPRRLSYRECAAGMLIFWVVASLSLPDGNFSCESDCILGVVFAAAVYVVMRHDRSVYDDLLLALLLAWLFLIKKAGMGFAVMTQLLYIVRWVADRTGGKTPKRPIWSFLVVLAAPFLMQASWSLLLAVYDTPIKFPAGKISPDGIWELVRYGEPDHGREVAARFGMKLVIRAPFFLLAMFAFVRYRKRADNRPRRDGDLLWFLPLAFAVYLASLFLTYMFIFNIEQAKRLVSFRRYIHGFLLMPIGAVLMLMLSDGREGKVRRFFASNAGLALLLACEVGLYHWENFLVKPIAKRWVRDRVVLEARCGRILRADGASFVAVSGAGDGLYHPILKYEYGYSFVDETPLCDLDDQAELLEFVKQARYVLIVMPPENMAREFPDIWETPPELKKDFTLFEVTPRGKLRPVR